MKKRIISISLMIVMLFSIMSFATTTEDIGVLIDNSKVEFDVQPQIVNGRTLVPVRAIFESLEMTVGWDSETQTVTGEKEGLKISLKINNNNGSKNGKEIPLDAPATIIDGRTMVPVRFIAESTGAQVKWNGEKKQVEIYAKTNPPIEPVVENANLQISVEATTTIITAPEPTQQVQQITYMYYGSDKSDKYHYLTCRYYKKILPENLVGFTSKVDAGSKGYVACKVCKP